MTIDYHEIITIEPGKRSGKPCIRGLRITVDDILDCFAAGMNKQEVLDDYDYLTQDDILGLALLMPQIWNAIAVLLPDEATI